MLCVFCLLFLARQGPIIGGMVIFHVSRAGPQAGRPGLRRRKGGEAATPAGRTSTTVNPQIAVGRKG